MKGMIFAAGLGTRLKPYTDTMPKALVPVGGVTMLERTITTLRDAGVDDIVVNVHHFADQIIDFFDKHGTFGCHISISDERDLLRDTGGAIAHARPLLQDSSPFLVHNVDIASNLDLRRFASEEVAAANLLVSNRQSSRYLLFDSEMRLVGWTNVKTGEVKSPYPALDPASCIHRAFAGIHLMGQEIFEHMDGWPQKFSIIDYYISICDKALIRGVEYDGVEVHDLGSAEKIDAYIKNNPQIDVTPDCHCEDAIGGCGNL